MKIVDADIKDMRIHVEYNEDSKEWWLIVNDTFERLLADEEVAILKEGMDGAYSLGFSEI